MSEVRDDTPAEPTPPEPRSGWLMPILQIAISMLVALAIGEGVLRLAWENPYRTETPDRYVMLRMHHASRNLPVNVSGVTPERATVYLGTDERSYILPSARFKDPDATIAFLGGSTTECSALLGEERFPARVSTLLEERGIRVNALNAARSGNTTHDSLNVLLNHVVADRPDVAVLMHAANDIGVLAADGSYRSRWGAPATFRLGARWLFQRMSSYSSFVGAGRWWATSQHQANNDFDARENLPRERAAIENQDFADRLEAFVAMARAFGIAPVLMTQPAISSRTPLTPGWIDLPNQQVFNELIRSVAKQEDAVLVDLEQHVKQIEGWDQPMVVFYDGIHVSAEGARIYAELIVRRLLESGVLSSSARSR